MKMLNFKLYSLFLYAIIVFNQIISVQNQFPNSNDSKTQQAYTVDNVRGFSIDPVTQKIDNTEGFGAFDSLVKLSNLGPRNFDNGGGSYDDNTNYVKEQYNIENLVYDPFKRNCEHNLEVIKYALDNPFDTCTSFSVLNVIDLEKSRLEHIKLCHNILKLKGQAFFKTWSGNTSRISTREPGRYQSNQRIDYYLDEVKKIFGEQSVIFDKQTNTIIATKI